MTSVCPGETGNASRIAKASELAATRRAESNGEVIEWRALSHGSGQRVSVAVLRLPLTAGTPGRPFQIGRSEPLPA